MTALDIVMSSHLIEIIKRINTKIACFLRVIQWQDNMCRGDMSRGRGC